jgi:outer membrane protein assembly factor BamB
MKSHRPALVLAMGILVLSLGVSGATASSFQGWLTSGFDLQRTGHNPDEHTINHRSAHSLHQVWSDGLGGAIDTAPIVVNDVSVNGHATDLVFAGTEHGSFYAIDAASGHVVWHRFLGASKTRCSDLPGRVFGITSAPVADPAAGVIYVAGGNSSVYALAMSTGTVLAGWPVAVANPTRLHVWSALTLNNGMLDAETASFCDIRPYHGSIAAIDVAKHRVVHRFFPTGRHGPDGGAIWGWGGASVDASTGDVFVTTGNAFAPSEAARFAERVVRLTPDLRVVASDHPHLRGVDVDFGSTPVLFTPTGCGEQLAIENKSGVFLTYAANDISGGPLQRIQMADVLGDMFDGEPAWSPDTQTLYVADSQDSSSGRYRHGLVALRAGHDCRLHLAWQRTVGPDESVLSVPSDANGVVTYGDGIGNTVRVFDDRTGATLWTSGATIHGPVFAQPAIANGMLFVGSWDRHLHAYRPR